MQLALKILNFDFEGEQKTVIAALKDIVEQYSNLDLDIDKEVFTALLKEYRSKSGYHFPAGNLPYYRTEI